MYLEVTETGGDMKEPPAGGLAPGLGPGHQDHSPHGRDMEQFHLDLIIGEQDTKGLTISRSRPPR